MTDTTWLRAIANRLFQFSFRLESSTNGPRSDLLLIADDLERAILEIEKRRELPEKRTQPFKTSTISNSINKGISDVESLE